MEYVAIAPVQYRDILIAAFDAKFSTWGQTYCALYNVGWRGPYNKEGFGTTFIGSNGS